MIKAFGRYTIEKNQRFNVYRGATLAFQTSSTRVALSWCVADKLGKHTLAKEIELLDNEVTNRNEDILNYRDFIRRCQDPARRDIVIDRLDDAISRAKLSQHRLDKCINLAKYWQQKGFRDETARFRIKNTDSTKPESF